MEAITNALGGAFTGVIYSIMFYVKKRQRPDNAEDFNWKKLIATALIGLGIGVLSTINGDTLTQESLEIQMLTYAGLIMVVENALKTGYRWIDNI